MSDTTALPDLPRPQRVAVRRQLARAARHLAKAIDALPEKGEAEQKWTKEITVVSEQVGRLKAGLPKPRRWWVGKR